MPMARGFKGFRGSHGGNSKPGNLIAQHYDGSCIDPGRDIVEQLVVKAVSQAKVMSQDDGETEALLGSSQGALQEG
jgi:hypothetical protein